MSIEPHLDDVGDDLLGHEGGVELTVPAVLDTAGDGAFIDHDLQVPRPRVGRINWTQVDRSVALNVEVLGLFPSLPKVLHHSSLNLCKFSLIPGSSP